MPLADVGRVGDQVSTCGFSTRLNRSQSRYHRRAQRPHLALTRPSVKRAAALRYSEIMGGTTVLTTLGEAWASIRSRDDPAELAIGHFNEPMTNSQLYQDLAFEYERVRTGHINE